MEFLKMIMEVSAAGFFGVAAYRLHKAEEAMRDSNVRTLQLGLAAMQDVYTSEKTYRELAQERYLEMLSMHEEQKKAWEAEKKCLKTALNSAEETLMTERAARMSNLEYVITCDSQNVEMSND